MFKVFLNTQNINLKKINNKRMGNSQNSSCLSLTSTKDPTSDRDVVNYIASYKPGRKLIFRKLYYHEANSLIKSKNSQNDPENSISNNISNNQKPVEYPIEEEEIKENVL